MGVFIRFGQRLIDRKAPFLLLLAPISWMWGLVVFCKNKLYDWGFFPVYKVNCAVVSVGNIVAGGTGKTPMVHLLAKSFFHRKVAILSRGYGPMPDEPMVLSRRLPGVKVYVGKDRTTSARRAVDEGAELIILDDGFQHRRLHRDFDIVSSEVSSRYLPCGFLRDNPNRLKKADALFSQNEGNIQIEHCVSRKLDIEGMPVGLFCGIAKPDRFKKTVVGQGALVVAEWVLGDHQPAPSLALKKFSSKCKALGAKALICTEKDYVKLPEEKGELPIFFLEVEMKIIKGQDLWEKLIEKIDQKIDNYCQS